MANRDANVHAQHRAWDPVALPPHGWLPGGLAVGLVGGAAVALWFLILDTLTRAPLYTPAALGSVFFFGANGPEEIRRTFPVIAGYTVLHFAVFMVLGALFSWMVDKVQSAPRRWLMMLMTFILLDGLFAGTLAMIGEWVIASIGVWAIIVGNVVAVLAMGATLWATHPELRHRLVGTAVQTTV
ncbi:MAG: hypothetical protein HY700_22165 [Gemmatimonadetes bacterium]|nr:hypothetical protein [Gemmatimonadota bacterium]